MQYIYVNFKRFDIPPSFGGVNRIGESRTWGEQIVRKTLPSLERLAGQDVRFAQFYPEAHLVGALEALGPSNVLAVGCQGVHRADTEIGGNFGAFTTNRPANAMKALGCTDTIIGHCEERADKNEILGMGGNTDRTAVNRLLNKEVRCAQRAGMEVLYCIGEQESEMDDWQEVLSEQLQIGLAGCDTSSVVIAYEPVWSIGPGKTPAGKEYIAKVARFVKKTIGNVPVIYGGGLKQDNAAMIASIDEIDGGLIALTRFAGEIGFYPDEYVQIIRTYLEKRRQKGASK
jgi:triosephosphate isomerase